MNNLTENSYRMSNSDCLRHIINELSEFRSTDEFVDELSVDVLNIAITKIVEQNIMLMTQEVK